jgi:hypothetical protein
MNPLTAAFITATACTNSDKIPQRFPADTRTRRIMPRGCLPSARFPRRLGGTDAYGVTYTHTHGGVRRMSDRVVEVKRAERRSRRLEIAA